MAQRRVFVQKALVVAVMGCMGTILAAEQRKEQSTARTVVQDARIIPRLLTFCSQERWPSSVALAPGELSPTLPLQD
jgi:hypothetical protein